MRKIFSVLLILALCLSLLAGCGLNIGLPEETEKPAQSSSPTQTDPTPAPSQEMLSSEMLQLQEQLYDSNTLCAVAYLGSGEGDFASLMDSFTQSGLMGKLPILKELSSDAFVEMEGSELYLVVPREDASLTVHQQLMDNETGEMIRGKALYTANEAQPLLLRGNVSDIVPNLCLFLEGQGGQCVEYHPSLSLADGSLNSHSLIYDLTPHSQMDDPMVGGEDMRMGSWFTEALNTSGESVVLILTLDYDGSVTYSYGYPQCGPLEYFEGNWQEEDGRLLMELYGGPADADSESDGVKYDASLVFEWRYWDGHLLLDHISGESLIVGMEGGSFDFVPSNYYALRGVWCSGQYDSEVGDYVYCDLEFLENGECNLIKHNGEGTTYAAHEGWWSFDMGNITLSMKMIYGSEFQESIEQTLSGVYAAKIGTTGSLRLSYVSGDALTQYMTENGADYFIPIFSEG